jgi:6-phosphogluconolactonase
VDGLDFCKWKFAFVDERVVPLDSVDSNFFECSSQLFDKAGIESSNILAIDEFEDAGIAAQNYEQRLREFLDISPGEPLRFDTVLLGMGPDGHTASLFPGHALVQYIGSASILPIFDSPKPPAGRITLSLAAINQAGSVAMVVTGQAKAPVVAEIISWNPVKQMYHSGHDVFPAGMIRSAQRHACRYSLHANFPPHPHFRPSCGNLTWFLDENAASML